MKKNTLRILGFSLLGILGHGEVAEAGKAKSLQGASYEDSQEMLLGRQKSMDMDVMHQGKDITSPFEDSSSSINSDDFGNESFVEEVDSMLKNEFGAYHNEQSLDDSFKSYGEEEGINIVACQKKKNTDSFWQDLFLKNSFLHASSLFCLFSICFFPNCVALRDIFLGCMMLSVVPKFVHDVPQG